MFQVLIPILRIFDVPKAEEFYLNYLEFKLDWVHRFEEDLPLYMQISNNGLVIHLSEHHGDCSPGAAIRIEVKDIRDFHKKLAKKQYKYLRPELEKTPWKSVECRVTDPFGNKIIFYEFITHTEVT